MIFYQITFNNLEGFDITKIHEFITKKIGVGDWWHYLPNVYIIPSASTSYSLANKIIASFPGLNFIITKIDINDYNGFLDKRAWEWLVEKAKQRGVQYVPHASSPLSSLFPYMPLPPMPKIPTTNTGDYRKTLAEILRLKNKNQG